jgi:phage terminase Nu1 subunit (DNA packaging protein)
MRVDQGSGVRVLADPLTNKGTAFSEKERSELGSRGLLPTAAETLAQQVHRRYQACQEQPTDDTATGVARAVAKAAVADAVAPALTDDEIDRAIHRTRWLPSYHS